MIDTSKHRCHLLIPGKAQGAIAHKVFLYLMSSIDAGTSVRFGSNEKEGIRPVAIA